MMNIAYTAERSRPLPSTRRSTSGTLPCCMCRRVHRKNSWPSTRPSTTSTGAGDSPRIDSGAVSSATTSPQALRLLKPSVSITTAAPIRTEATRSMRIERSPRSERSEKLRAKTTIASARVMTKIGLQPTKVPSVPPIRNALTPENARRAQGADGGGLLRSAVVLRDQRDQRRHDDRSRCPGQQLSDDRPGHRAGQDHGQGRGGEHPQHAAEDESPADPLAEFRTRHHQRSHRQTVDHDGGAGDGGW